MKCSFCLKTNALYQCPRCSKQYCSLICYKAKTHDICIQGFYKDQVEQDLRNTEVSDAEKEKLIRMINKYQDRSDNDWKYEHPDEKFKQHFEKTREFLNMKNDEDLTELEYEELEKHVEMASSDELLAMLTAEQRKKFEEMIKNDYEIIDENEETE